MEKKEEKKCSRCGAKLPEGWEWKECKKCHERTLRRRTKNKVPIAKIEAKVISQLVDAENAWRRHKNFMQKRGCQPQPKEQFIEGFLRNNAPRIQQIKTLISQYNDSKCPLLSVDCLEFRRLFSQRLNYVDPAIWASEIPAKELNFFHEHLSCPTCSRYSVAHKYDMPVEQKEPEECSQEECDKRRDEFFEVVKPKGDPIDEWMDKQGFKPIPEELQKHLSSEYGKQEQSAQTNDPYLQKINQEWKQEEEETARLNALPQDKLKKWLEEKQEGE